MITLTVAEYVLVQVTGRGRELWRKALVSFTIGMTALALLLAVLKFIHPVLLLISLVSLAGSALAMRPQSDPWFETPVSETAVSETLGEPHE